MSINPLTFALISLIVTLMLAILYFIQNKEKSISSKKYKQLLIITLVAIINIFVFYITLYFTKNMIIGRILSYIKEVTMIIYIIVIYEYIDIKFQTNQDDIKRIYKKEIIWIIPAIIAAAVILFFLKTSSIDDFGDIIITPYKSFMVPATIFMITIGILLIKSIKYKNEKQLKLAMKISIIFTVFNSAEVLLVNISIFPIGATLVALMLYFSYENPDLYVMNQLEEVSSKLKISNTNEGNSVVVMQESIKESLEEIKNSDNKIHNENDLSKKLEEYKNIINNGNKILNILDNIFDNTISNDSKENTDYNVEEVVNDILNKYRYQINEHNVETSIYVNPGTPYKLHGQKGKFEKLLRNITSNALTYTDYGKVNISINSENNKDECKLKINISDTSDGINIENDKLTGRKINIQLAKKYAKELGGDINIEDTYLAGTRVEVNLSQSIADPTPIKAKPSTTKDILKGIDYRGKKVIVVDENKLNRKVLTSILKKYCFDVIECSSGEECINKIKSNEEYHLILLDHQMEDASGVEVMIALKKLKEFFKVPPVIMVSANTGSNLREYYLSVGFNEYIAKPITVNEIQNALKKYVPGNVKKEPEIEAEKNEPMV